MDFAKFMHLILSWENDDDDDGEEKDKNTSKSRISSILLYFGLADRLQ